MARKRKKTQGETASEKRESVRRLAEAIAVVCTTTQGLYECLVEATRMLEAGRRPDHLDWPEQQDARDELAAKLSEPDRPVRIGGGWTSQLTEIDTMLACWWTALESAFDLLDRAGVLVDDPRAAPIDRWSTKMRQSLRGLAASLGYTDPKGGLGHRALRMLIVNLERIGVPQTWPPAWRSLSSETHRLFAIHAEEPIVGARRPLTDRQRELWNALDGCILSAKELAADKELTSTEDAVTHLVAAIRKRGRGIETVPGRGYYRPDAPPPEFADGS